MAEPKKKLKPVRVQGFEVELYRLGDGRTAFADKYGGPRKVRKFTDEAQARAEAEKMAYRVLRGEAVRHEFSPKDIAVFQHLQEMIAPLGVPLVSALEEWVALRKIAGDRALLDVVRSGVDTMNRPSKTCREATEALLGEKQLGGLSTVYLDELKEDLTSFNDDFGDEPIVRVTTEQIVEWLVKRPHRHKPERGLSMRRRNNIRGTLVTLFLFAQAQNWLPPGKTAPQKIKKGKIVSGMVTVYTPQEMQYWISIVKEEFLPWLLIGGFSGVRSEEICPDPESKKDRLRWSDFKWTKRHINIRPEVSKVGERRLVPISDNLMMWLTPWMEANAKGPVIEEGKRTANEARRFNRVSRRLTAKAKKDPINYQHPQPGLLWRHNALRHSYGSYRQAVIKNMHQLAHEMGNSVDVIKKNYHEAQEDEVAAAWFAIKPEGDLENVMQLSFGNC